MRTTAVQRALPRLIMIGMLSCAPGFAQYATSYATHYFSSDGRTLYATTTTSGSMNTSAGYTHDYYAYVSISGPPGSSGSTGGGLVSSGWVPAASVGTAQSTGQISTVVDGSYMISTDGYAYCSDVGEFMNDQPPPQGPIVDSPVINMAGVVDSSTQQPYGYVGTSGTLSIYGLWLTADGQDPSPTVSSDDSNLQLSAPSYAGDQQLNVPYTIKPGARNGSHSIYVTTTYGQSNPGTFGVYDETPVITSISPSAFAAGNSYSVTISGSHFGSVCPTVSISGAGNSTFTASGPCSDTSVQGTAAFDVNATGPSATLTLTSSGYGSGFLPVPGQSNQGSKSVIVYPLTVTQSPSIINLSTGDKNTAITVSVIPSTTSFTPTFSSGLLRNPNSSCSANLDFTSNPGTGSVNETVTAGAAGCSGVFSTTAYVGARSATGATQVTVPPQILIQFLVGEASGQTAPADMSQPAIAVSARNRFGDASFPGGTTATYQAVIIPSQYYGASNTTPNGVQPEMANSVGVFSGTTGAVVQNAKCYWSPTAAQWATIQQALSSQTAAFPANVGAPSCWAGQPRQIVYKTSVAANTRGGSYAGAPAFLFLQQIPQSNVPAVVQIP